MVHQSIAGGVIGKGGEKIKEIREKAECNVKVAADCAPMSTERVVQVNGWINRGKGIQTISR